MTLIIPSYQNGFASPQHMEPANPGLWNGILGFWAPSLGVTGLTLFDPGGRSGNGTLTGMDPATAWVAGPNGYSLVYDGASEYVEASLDYIAPPFTLNAWVQSTQISTSYRGVLSRGAWTSADSNFEMGIRKDGVGYDGVYCFWKNGASLQGSGFATADTELIIDGQWHLLTVVLAADSAMTMYIDGVLVGTDAANSAPTNGAYSLKIASGVADFAGNTGTVAIHNRAISRNEIQQLYQDPHAIVRPMQRLLVGTTAVGNPWYHYAQQAAIIG